MIRWFINCNEMDKVHGKKRPMPCSLLALLKTYKAY